MISKINSILSIALVFLLSSTFHLHGVDARKRTLRGEGYRRAVQDLGYTIVPNPTATENCPSIPPQHDETCEGSNKRSKNWSSCAYAISSESRDFFGKQWQCNCGTDSKFDCRLRGLAPLN
jgi:hypothetical protein